MQGAGSTMFRAVIAFLLLLAWPATAAPPPQGFKWWQGPRAKELGLTSDQSAKIEEIFQAALPRLKTAGEDADRLQKELSRLISADKTTEMDVVRQLNQVQAARNELDRQRTLMLFRMYRELSPDQRKAVARWEHERRGGRRGEPPQRPPQIKK